MKVKIISTGVWHLFDKHPFEDDIERINEYIDILKKYNLKQIDEDAYIEVNSIEQIVDIIKDIKRTDELVVSYDEEAEELTFEIYDTYRE